MSVFVFLKDIILIIIGCVLASFGTASFLVPAKLSSGGFAGIATIFYYFFEFKIGTVIIILNLPLFIYSYFKFGKIFTIKSVFATITYSKLIDWFDYINIYINDKFLACVYGGILVGLGIALVLKGGASTGGTDLVAKIALEKQIKAKISSIVIVIDIFVVSLNIIAFKALEIGLYSFISIWIIGKMIDLLFEGINYSKTIFIITKEYEKISNYLNRELERGTTFLYAENGYKKTNTKIIMCVCNRYDVEEVKRTSKNIDPNAFIIITDAREVYGLGFKKHQGL